MMTTEEWNDKPTGTQAMTDEELITRLRDLGLNSPNIAADRIEQLLEERDEAEWVEVLRKTYQRAKTAEAKLAKTVEALRLARVHVANNEQGWSVSRAAARYDLEIIAAVLEKLEETE